ncbi:uncharacterized protein LTR77_000414 [Saxophila tyrrhenica]|uniref:Uncharacterized protein n=1 Tax=Saxophila tyrrhenica TaxID=1690608 RepID=A0AAV9PN80_9PEZI|nr:hypothetical protein LTR77_000414 [Saxophila tyrrhenica]
MSVAANALDPAVYAFANSGPPSTRRWALEEGALIVHLRSMGMYWSNIAKHLPGRSTNSCSERHQKLETLERIATNAPGPEQHLSSEPEVPWKPEEDALIIQLRNSGTTWGDIGEHMAGRSGMSCKLRYHNYLRPEPQDHAAANAARQSQQPPGQSSTQQIEAASSDPQFGTLPSVAGRQHAHVQSKLQLPPVLGAKHPDTRQLPPLSSVTSQHGQLPSLSPAHAYGPTAASSSLPGSSSAATLASGLNPPQYGESPVKGQQGPSSSRTTKKPHQSNSRK